MLVKMAHVTLKDGTHIRVPADNLFIFADDFAIDFSDQKKTYINQACVQALCFYDRDAERASRYAD